MHALLAVISVGIALASCTNSTRAEHTVRTNNSTNGIPVDIVVHVGPKWANTFRVAGLFPIKSPPQVALWTEKPGGQYLSTLYVTEKFGKQSWKSTDVVPTETFRIEALPVWLHSLRDSGKDWPSRVSPVPDSITGSTPTDSFRIHTVIPGELSVVRIVLEVNLAFDENEYYPNSASPDHPGYNGVSGQPSLVYSGNVQPGKPGAYPLKLAGHGHPAGVDGVIYQDIATVTTATDLILSCSVVVP